MKKIISIVAVLLVALFLTNCSKSENENENDAQINELIGSWKGTSSSMYIDGKPADEIVYILTFTKDKLTVSKDGQATTNPYIVGKNLEGKKFFTEMDNDDKYSMYYSISGTTLSLLEGNSTYTFWWPKTLEKALN